MKRGLKIEIISIITICIVGCIFVLNTSAEASTTSNQPLKIGFLQVGPINDKGWGYYHEQGRLHLQNALKGKVETICAECIAENSDAERVMEKMIAQGCKLIFTTSYGYLEPALKISKKHPDVIFMQVGRAVATKNLAGYMYRHDEPTYLAGVIAGRMTKNNMMGYLGMIPVAVMFQSMDSFALGVRSVNPKAIIRVIWTNTWFDAVLDSEAANSLIEKGVDVLAVPQSATSPVFKIAENKAVKVFGSYTAKTELAPKQWLTGVQFNWGPFYTQIAQSVIDHNWQSKVYVCDMKSGVVDLGPFGPAVPEAVRKEVLDLKEKITSGKLAVFVGPLKDSKGKLRLEASKKPDIDWIAKMNFFVPGIEGSLPK